MSNPVPEDLHHSAAKAILAAIVESSDDAIVSKSLEGIIRTWNHGAERIFGWKAQEIIGKPITVIIPPDRLDEETRILAQLRAGERVDHFETVRMRKDGTFIDISVTVSPIYDDRGVIIGASKVARDITIQKRTQEELQRAKELAEQASRAKDEFISALSHELRTPLTPALAEVSFIESQPEVPEVVRDSIGMIRRNIETEARLVDDLLDVTRIARGKIRLHFEILDAHDAIRSAVAMFRSEMDAKSLELLLALRAKTHHIWADAGRFQQVLANLLSNAVKFTADGGTIAIRTSNESSNEFMTIDISDTGAGISPNMIATIFQPFEQSPSARKLGGLGLGLSIAKSLVEMHSATIAAESAGENQGAKFTIRINSIGAPSGSSTSLRNRPDPLKRPCRILLVEDHADTRRVLERLLRSLGYTVFPAATVREAISLAEHQTIDLLLSDIGLPDGTGADVMRTISQNRSVKGIALSGFGQEEDVARSREAGFENHLVKPINFVALREALSQATT